MGLFCTLYIVVYDFRGFFAAFVGEIQKREIHISDFAEPVRHIDGNAVENLAASRTAVDRKFNSFSINELACSLTFRTGFAVFLRAVSCQHERKSAVGKNAARRISADCLRLSKREFGRKEYPVHSHVGERPNGERIENI